MNKELDALKRFSHDFNEYIYDCNLIDHEEYRENLKSIDKDYDLLKQALKRNEPMKIDSPNYYGFGYFKCPKCKDIVVEEYDNYCRECGQKLDWSDDK